MIRRSVAIVTVISMLVLLCPVYAAEEGGLSPSSPYVITDGYIRGITEIPSAAHMAEQFTGEVSISLPDGTAAVGDTLLPSDSTVTVNGTDTARVLIVGDCNRDATVNLIDVSSILQYTAGWSTDICFPAADVGGDGGVNLADVSLLLKYIAGWDVSISEPVVLTVSFDEYVLLARDRDTDMRIVSAVKESTGIDVAVVTKPADGVKYITVGESLWENYSFMDSVRCRSLYPENPYMEVYDGNIYLTACGDAGIDECVDYLASAGSLTIPKGYKGTVGQLTGESAVLYAEAAERITESGDIGVMTDDIYTALVNAEYTEPKNIIIMIGDGMGRAALDAAEIIHGDSLHESILSMRHMPVAGSSQTYSDTDQFTDSAAGATAIATGYKTSESTVAMSFDDAEEYKTLLEIAAEKGKSTGVIATKFVEDATPAAFTAHAADRTMLNSIAQQQLASLAEGELDLIFGGGWYVYDREEVAPSLNAALEAGVTYTKDWNTAIEASLPVAGLFAYGDIPTEPDSEPSLAQMTSLALEKLSADEDGFFLMVEGSRIDYYGHHNEFANEADETYEFDCAVAEVLRFVALNPDTVVVVTADHETGGLRVNPDWTAENIYDNAEYLMARHHWVNVPIYSVGYGSGVLSGAVENTDIAIFAAGLMGESIGARSNRQTLFNIRDPETFQAIAEAYPEYTEIADEGLLVNFCPEFCRLTLPIPDRDADGFADANVRTVNITYKNLCGEAMTLPSLTLVTPDGNVLIEEWWNYVRDGDYYTQSYVLPADMIGDGNFSDVSEIIIGAGRKEPRRYIITDITVVDRPAGR